MRLSQYVDSSSQEEILLTLFNRSNDTLFLIKESRFLLINKKGEDFLGLSQKDLEGKDIYHFLPQQIVYSLKSLQQEKNEIGLTMESEGGRSLAVTIVLFSQHSTPIYLIQIKDETSYQKVSRALAQSKKDYRSIVESLEDGYYEVDLKGNFTFFNRALCSILGFTYPEGIGVNYRQFYTNPEMVFEAFNKVYRTGIPQKGFRWTILTTNGEERFVDISISLMRDGEGNPKGFSGVARDCTEQRRTEKRLFYLSRKDVLTNLYNRYHFEEELKRLKDEKVQELTLFVFDIDGLKFINDTLGHEMGDALLKSVSSILSSSFRENDLIARIGGDEFAAIIPSYSEGLIERITETIKREINRHNQYSSSLPISLSIGVAYTKGELVDPEGILRQADDAMYRKKRMKEDTKERILHHFLKSLERKDFFQRGHLDRIKEFSLPLAEHLGLSSDQCRLLSLMAQYHDLGQVGIVDRIIYKKGPLTLQEFDSIKRHVEIGSRIVSHFPRLKDLTLLILYHHQWWNGEGYPGDRKGDQIPLLSRLFMVVDTLEALTGYRPYREPVTQREALLLIEKGAGVQFDPYLVERLFELVESDHLF